MSDLVGLKPLEAGQCFRPTVKIRRIIMIRKSQTPRSGAMFQTIRRIVQKGRTLMSQTPRSGAMFQTK